MVPPKPRFSIKCYPGKKQAKQSIAFPNLDPFDELLPISPVTTHLSSFESSFVKPCSSSQSRSSVKSEINNSNQSVNSSSYLKNLQGCSNTLKKCYGSRSGKKKHLSESKINKITNKLREIELNSDSFIVTVSSTPVIKSNRLRSNSFINSETASDLSPIDKSNSGRNADDQNGTPLSSIRTEEANDLMNSVLESSRDENVSLCDSPCTRESRRKCWKDRHYLDEEKVSIVSECYDADPEPQQISDESRPKFMTVAQMFRPLIERFMIDSCSSCTDSDNSKQDDSISRELSASFTGCANNELSIQHLSSQQNCVGQSDQSFVAENNKFISSALPIEESRCQEMSTSQSNHGIVSENSYFGKSIQSAEESKCQKMSTSQSNPSIVSENNYFGVQCVDESRYRQMSTSQSNQSIVSENSYFSKSVQCVEESRYKKMSTSQSNQNIVTENTYFGKSVQCVDESRYRRMSASQSNQSTASESSFNESGADCGNLAEDLTQLSSKQTPDRVTVTRRHNFQQGGEYHSLDGNENCSHFNESELSKNLSGSGLRSKSTSFVRSPISERRCARNDADRRKIYEKLSKSLPAWFKDSTPLVYDRMYDVDPRRSRKSLSRMKDELSYSNLTSSTKSLPAVLEDQNLEQINNEELHSPRVSFKKSITDHSYLNSPLLLGFSNMDLVKRRTFVKKHSDDSSSTSPHTTLPVLPEDESDSSSCEDESKRLESSSSRSEGPLSPLHEDYSNVVSPRASSPEPSAASSEEDSGSSPIRRDEQRRRRPSRLSSKRTLGYIAEEAESDSSELSNLPNFNRDGLVLMPGKKCRRSLAIIRNHFSKNPNEEMIYYENKGRNYLESVQAVRQLQRANTDQSSFLDPLFRHDSSDTSPDPTSSSVNKSDLSTLSNSRSSSHLTSEDLSDLSPDNRRSTYSLFRRKSTLCFINSKPEDITVACSQISNNYARESLESESESCVFQRAMLGFCNQERIIDFSQVFADNSLRTWKKIGEGVYSEVFSLTRKGESPAVLKIIPIDGDIMVNGCPQKSLEENINEILITKYLSELSDFSNICSGFVKLAHIWYLQGSYPKELLKLWEEFNDLLGSDNDHPNIFPTDQHYIGLELINSGKALESYRFVTAKQSFSVLQQIVLSLAVAEEVYQFEHRDLHWGNVLVDRTKDKIIIYNLKGQEYRVATNGLKSTIIDYTWSSITFNIPESGDNVRIVTDMEQDVDLFTGKGDLQFDIYRDMRSDVDKDWSKFMPKTNVRWIYYLTDKLIHVAKYSRPSTQTHKMAIDTMNTFLEEILLCDNCFQVTMKMLDYL